jgi:hypothetical protein
MASERIDLVDPTSEDVVAAVAEAARPPRLAGATVGMISNGKTGTAPLFDALEAILRGRYGVAEVVRRTKGNYSAPAEAELMAEAAGWAVLFAGVGD